MTQVDLSQPAPVLVQPSHCPHNDARHLHAVSVTRPPHSRDTDMQFAQQLAVSFLLYSSATPFPHLFSTSLFPSCSLLPPFSPSPPVPLTLSPARGPGRVFVSYPSGVWDEAPASNIFFTIMTLENTSSGNRFSSFSSPVGRSGPTDRSDGDHSQIGTPWIRHCDKANCTFLLLLRF